MVYVMVHVESDGPIPGDYSMIALGAVVVETKFDGRFSMLLQPVSDRFVANALGDAVCSTEAMIRFIFVDNAMRAAVLRIVVPGARPAPGCCAR
ncbi:MAG: hypothetical protein ACOC0E_11135 [Spirochaetota bacterium]